MRSWRRLFPADKNDKLLSLQNIFVTFEEIKDLYYLSFLHIYSTTGRQLVQRQRLECGSLSGFFSKKSWHVLPYRTKMFWVSSFAFFFFFFCNFLGPPLLEEREYLPWFLGYFDIYILSRPPN